MSRKIGRNRGLVRPESQDPIEELVTGGLNILVESGLQKLGQDVANKLGLRDPKEEIALRKSELNLKKAENDLARQERKQAEEQARQEELRAKRERQAAKDEREAKLLDLKIREKEIEIQKAEQNLEVAANQQQNVQVNLNLRAEPISGALEQTANPEGLTGNPEQQEAYREWLDSFEEGKIILILGKRGSGKSALAAKIAEYMKAVHRMPTYWVGLPQQARQLLPSWIKLTDDPAKVSMGAFVLCDEAGVNYLSLLFNTTENRFMRKLLMIARQRHISMAFAAQSSRDIDYSIARQADSVIFKQPGLNQMDSERPDMRPKAKRAAQAFKQLEKDNRIEAAYVCDDAFEGMIQSTLPSFWSEDLSHIYANLDLSEIEGQGKALQEADKTVETETKQLRDSELDKRILQMRQQGDGIQKIAKTLGCSAWRVRKALNS